MRMTPDRIAAAEKRCEEATLTPAPWRIGCLPSWAGDGSAPFRRVWSGPEDSRAYKVCECEDEDGELPERGSVDADADFIAAARTDLPDALADLSAAVGLLRRTQLENMQHPSSTLAGDIAAFLST